MKNNLVNQLAKLVQKDPRLAGRIAFVLGYRSTSTVMNWILRGNIPEYRIDEVQKILNERKRA
jgi:hypothetical protein